LDPFGTYRTRSKKMGKYDTMEINGMNEVMEE
jgi:hypothetical protein